MPFLTCSTILYTFNNCHMGQCHDILDKLQRSSVIIIHYVKYQKIIKFPCVEILQKRTVIHSNSKNTICPKFCGNCALPQNFHTRKLGETTVYYAVTIIIIIIINMKGSFFFQFGFHNFGKSNKQVLEKGLCCVFNCSGSWKYLQKLTTCSFL